MYSIYWLIVLAVLILIEIITLGLTTIWFAGGALVAFIVSLFVDNIILEIILFLLVSFALLYFTRPLVIKHFNPKRTKTNYQGVIGKEAMVTITIDNMNATGQVIVDGQEWSARSLDGNVIEKGTKVKVEGISGVKLIVSII
ncbi:MAG TPA: NfeD family protein [Clostridiales bacterium]|jgi:membrane protein implicated in regulation of membrane protease activity|nr:NfeD family protein [Clostridiales bacterium]